jgi:adenine C2-methylase RlmN of 23S rRNA A2503 and tRNA A37
MGPRARKHGPKSLLDVPALTAAFKEAGIKECHLKSVWKRVLDGAKNLEEVAEGIEWDKHSRQTFLQLDFEPIISEVVEVKMNEESGTGCKMVVRLQDDLVVETVIIQVAPDSRLTPKNGTPPPRRATVCVSSQVGCKMGCTFCETGTMGLQGNLTAGEILEQVYFAQLHTSQGALLRNVVFMGMGEPLENYDNVLAAVKGMNDQRLFDLKRIQITVSTVGVVERIKDLAIDFPGISLALSLHAPTQDSRKIIVPSAGAFRMERLMEVLDSSLITVHKISSTLHNETVHARFFIMMVRY